MMFKPSTVLYAVLGLSTFGNSAAVPAEDVAATSPILEKRVWLSNIDVQQACYQQVNSGASAIRKGNGCGDWRCLYANVEHSVNMAVYCANRHGTHAYAACGGGSVWDWQCHDRN